MTTCCDKCKSPLPDPTGLDLLAFQLRNGFWEPNYVVGLPVPAWQFLEEEEQESWRRVARIAMELCKNFKKPM
jgi:hypothetical protein